MNRLYVFILATFLLGLLSCDRTVIIPEEYPEEPNGFCYEYDKDTTQCYIPGKICYLYFGEFTSHMICSKR